ncbi:Zinc carboxypeptidase A 1, partial [Gryllus bimaculatus]
MLRYMQYLATTYPKQVEVLTIGQSSRGLPLKVAKVSVGGHRTKDGEPKPAVWIDGGMHAREWIAPAVALYALKQLVENVKVNRRVAEAADWYILPVANPDGYEYTHTTDRLWRKTRSRHGDERARARRSGRFFWDSCE